MKIYTNLLNELVSMLSTPLALQQINTFRHIICRDIQSLLEDYGIHDEQQLVTLIDFWQNRIEEDKDSYPWEYVSIKLLQLSGVGYEALSIESQQRLINSPILLNGQKISGKDQFEKIEFFFRKSQKVK